jgi:DNA invertase Pin-like site-specific DNA recombinase
LKKVISQLKAGDVLLVTRLDRLARSTRDLLNIVAEVTAKGADFRSLRDEWANTTTPHGRLMVTVLGGLAEFERELIRIRTGEGRARARARGVRMGRKPKLTSHQRMEALRRLDADEAVTEIARSYAVSHPPYLGFGRAPLRSARGPENSRCSRGAYHSFSPVSKVPRTCR